MKNHFRGMSRLGVLVIVLLIFGTSTVFAESEPNDTFAEADPVGIGLSNAEVGATLTTNDLDYYSFTVVAGRTYVIETYNIQGTGSDATGLWLYDQSETLIASDRFGQNGTGHAHARIVYTFLTPGTYFVLVAQEDYRTWTGTYSLRILPKYDEPGAEWDPANDYEPNDVKELAIEIETGLSNGQTHQLFNNSNFVTNGSDFDFYRFQAETGRTYVIETYNIQGTGIDATGLWLYDQSETLIASDRFGQNGTGHAHARIVYTFLTPGTYFVLVAQEDYRTWTGTYSLRILPKYDEPGAEWDPANDDEPNDVLPLANAIGVGAENAQNHQLFDNSNYMTNGSDWDFYHFYAEAGKSYVIQTYNLQATGRATGLWLYNSFGTELASDPFGDYETGEAGIVFTFVTAGEYFFLVTEAAYTSWTGSYSIRVCEDSCQQKVFLPVIVR